MIVDNDAINIDLPGDLDSLFGDCDLDRCFAELEARPVIEYNSCRATNQNADAPAGQTNGLVSGNEFEKSNTRGSSTRRVVERRDNAKRRRSKSQHNLLDAMYISNELQVIRRLSSTAAATAEPWRATSRVCLRIAARNGPN